MTNKYNIISCACMHEPENRLPFDEKPLLSFFLLGMQMPSQIHFASLFISSSISLIEQPVIIGVK